MGLLTAGYFPATYWAESYWNDAYWQDYGYVAGTIIEVFMIRKSGMPTTGLSPIIDLFVKASDGTSAGTVPTVLELGGGNYKFYHSVTQDTVVRVDSTDVAMSPEERYIDVGVITPFDDVMNPSGIADAVWNELRNVHTTLGSFGEAIDQPLSTTENNIRGTDNDDLKDISDEIAELPTSDEIADAVWNEDLTGHTTAKTSGKIVQQIRSIVNAILGLIS